MKLYQYTSSALDQRGIVNRVPGKWYHYWDESQLHLHLESKSQNADDIKDAEDLAQRVLVEAALSLSDSPD